MSSGESVSQWIEKLKAGDERAAERLWQAYFRRLTGLAYQKLRATPRRVADEEDVVVSAFASFVRRAQQNQFPDLHDRNDLWHLIVKITERKAIDQVRAQRRKKRGGGKVLGESAFFGDGTWSDHEGIDQARGPEPTAEHAAMLTEAVQRLLGLLDEELRSVALMKLEGFNNAEIAARIARSTPTVERRLRLIRATWHGELGPTRG